MYIPENEFLLLRRRGVRDKESVHPKKQDFEKAPEKGERRRCAVANSNVRSWVLFSLVLSFSL